MLASYSQPIDRAAVLRALMKSCVYLARYLRQPMEWVEGLGFYEFNRWLEVVNEVLLEERGVNPDGERADPMAQLMGDD